MREAESANHSEGGEQTNEFTQHRVEGAVNQATASRRRKVGGAMVIEWMLIVGIVQKVGAEVCSKEGREVTTLFGERIPVSGPAMCSRENYAVHAA